MGLFISKDSFEIQLAKLKDEVSFLEETKKRAQKEREVWDQIISDCEENKMETKEKMNHIFREKIKEEAVSYGCDIANFSSLGKCNDRFWEYVEIREQQDGSGIYRDCYCLSYFKACSVVKAAFEELDIQCPKEEGRFTAPELARQVHFGFIGGRGYNESLYWHSGLRQFITTSCLSNYSGIFSREGRKGYQVAWKLREAL